MAPQLPIPGGYLLVARKLIESELFAKPPHYLKLWLWLLSKAFWRDGEAIQRGQLFTTIAEMRNVGLFKSGGRLQGRLTENQVRSAYGFLQDSGAVTVSKTTRGILVTILNYDIYQNPESYGPQAGHIPDPRHKTPQMLSIAITNQNSNDPDPGREPAKMQVSASRNQNSRHTGPPVDQDSASHDHLTDPGNTPDHGHESAQMSVNVSKNQKSATPGPRTGPGATPDPGRKPSKRLSLVSEKQISTNITPRTIPGTAPDHTHETPQMLGNVREIHDSTDSGPRTIPGTAPDHTPDPAQKPPQLLTFVDKFPNSFAPDHTPELPRTTDDREYSINKNLKTSCASSASKRPPSGDHQTFLAWWCMAYERTQGKPYLVTGKDFKPVKKLLGTHKLKPLIVMAAWFLTYRDTWLASKRDIAMFLSQINRIPGPKDEAHDAPTYWAAGIIWPEGTKFEEWRFWEHDSEAQEALAQ